MSEQHDDIVKIEYLTSSVYEYTHSEFRQLADQIRKVVCLETANEQAIIQLLNAVKIKARLYTDLSAAVSSVFSNRAGPIILPEETILALMRPRREWFINTVYWDEPNLVYQFGGVTPVHPLKADAIGYILHLPKILKPSRTALFCMSNLGVPKDKVLVRLKLPTHAVLRDGQLKEIDLNGCSATTSVSYLCMAALNLKDGCLTNASACSPLVRQLSRTEWMMTSFGYLLVSQEDCHFKSGPHSAKALLAKQKFHYVPLNTFSAVFCQPDILLSTEKREFEYSYQYDSGWNISEIKPEWEYAPKDWADAPRLQQLYEATKARKIDWSRLSEDNSQLALPISIGGALISIVFSLAACILASKGKRVQGAAPAVVVQTKIDVPKGAGSKDETVPLVELNKQSLPGQAMTPASFEYLAPPLYPTAPFMVPRGVPSEGLRGSYRSPQIGEGGLDF